MAQRLEFSDIPPEFAGRWALISYETPDGEKFGGEILDYWEWSATGIKHSDWQLTARSVVATIEEHHDMHLINFTNSMQFAVLRTKTQPDVILVVEYGNGKELMRCLFTQKV